jgi:hypothetical protein
LVPSSNNGTANELTSGWTAAAIDLPYAAYPVTVCAAPDAIAPPDASARIEETVGAAASATTSNVMKGIRFPNAASSSFSNTASAIPRYAGQFAIPSTDPISGSIS